MFDAKHNVSVPGDESGWWAGGLRAVRPSCVRPQPPRLHRSDARLVLLRPTAWSRSL